MSRNFWNRNPKIQNDREVNSIAKKEDYIFSYKGYMFLLQRYNDINNVIWVALHPECSVCTVFQKYLEYLRKRKIRYITITTASFKRHEIYSKMLERLHLDFVNTDTCKIQKDIIYELVVKIY